MPYILYIILIPCFTDSGFYNFGFYRFRVLQIPDFAIPGFADSGFYNSVFYRFRILQFRVIQIPDFTDSGFYRFRILQFRVLQILFYNSVFYRCLNIDCENDILRFNPHTYIFLYVRWLDVPSEGHVTTRVDISCSRMKKAFKLGSRASFLTARSLYLFQIAHFSQKFQFSAGIVRWWHVQSCSGTCHHETNLVRVNSFNNTCFKNNVAISSQTRQFRG